MASLCQDPLGERLLRLIAFDATALVRAVGRLWRLPAEQRAARAENAKRQIARCFSVDEAAIIVAAHD